MIASNGLNPVTEMRPDKNKSESKVTNLGLETVDAKMSDFGSKLVEPKGESLIKVTDSSLKISATQSVVTGKFAASQQSASNTSKVKEEKSALN